MLLRNVKAIMGGCSKIDKQNSLGYGLTCFNMWNEEKSGWFLTFNYIKGLDINDLNHFWGKSQPPLSFHFYAET